MSSPHWPEKKKIEVVTTWLALGKVPMVEGVTGVPQATIRQWKMQPWWKEMVDTIQTESNQELDTKLSKIIERSLDAVNERIEGGEFILDSRTGQVKRIPVKMKDVHRVAVDLLDKRDLLRGRPAQEKAELQNKDILKKLADQFADWVKLNMKQPKVIDIEGEVVSSSQSNVEPVMLSSSLEVESINIAQSPVKDEANTSPAT